MGVASAEGILQLIDVCERMGLDVMSAGIVLSWAIEAFNRGLITARETLDVPLKFNDVNGYSKALDLIVKIPNDFFGALASGVNYASAKYGGRDFAMALGGN